MMMTGHQSPVLSHQTENKIRYDIPENLLKPMWYRSQESLADDGLVYDPIAAKACKQCRLSAECIAGNLSQQQLLYATLTRLCDLRVEAFLKEFPNGWIVNVGAGLDTRFYRLDNGLCHWVEIDVNENLLWREKLFHQNERYQVRLGAAESSEWLDNLPVPENAPVLIVCEQALLNSKEQQVAGFIQALGRHFTNAKACLVIAGDKSSTPLGKRLGCEEYQHGFDLPSAKVANWLPWNKWVKSYSPLDHDCGRWKMWQKLLAKVSFLKFRLTPTLIELSW